MTNRELDRVLEAWRSAERARDGAEPGSPDWERADAEAAQMRESYHALLEERALVEERLVEEAPSEGEGAGGGGLRWPADRGA